MEVLLNPEYAMFCALGKQLEHADREWRNETKHSRDMEKIYDKQMRQVATDKQWQGHVAAFTAVLSGIGSIGGAVAQVAGVNKTITNIVKVAAHAIEGGGNAFGTYQRGWEHTSQAAADKTQRAMQESNRVREDYTQTRNTLANQMDKLADGVKNTLVSH